MNATVDADKNVDAAENLPSIDDVPPDHFIHQYDLDKMKAIYLKGIIKARGLIIEGKKADLKLQLQQAVPAGVNNISEEETQQPRNQMEGLHPAYQREELKHMEDIVESTDDDEEFRAPTVPEGQADPRKYNYQEAFERPDFSGTCDVAIFTPRGHQ